MDFVSLSTPYPSPLSNLPLISATKQSLRLSASLESLECFNSLRSDFSFSTSLAFNLKREVYGGSKREILKLCSRV
ncbi:hypothetical protein TorRG33x02_322210 [Trema orientale]|uniref:Uncharacterized protein n=1 Tax=Trema orientale TaxID=63057 RepID=A0A2P5BG87_TREOI|nr:hypothetical protein TorRG33x02_322210 [Trema orientale]